MSVEEVAGRDKGSALPAPDHTQAALYYIAAVALFSIMDATVKDIAFRYPTVEVAFLRYFTGLIVIMLIIAVLRPGWPRREMVLVNGLRSSLTCLTALTFFFSLTALPLAEAVSLTFLSPCFLAVFGAWFLKERLSPRIGIALCVGFAGMLVITGGQIGRTAYGPWALAGALAALASAVVYALSMVMLRSRATTDSIPLIVLVLHAGTTALLTLPVLFVWHQPPLGDLMVFCAIGAMGTIGHLLMANAFARSQAGRLAPLEYTALLWASGLGFVFFGEVPGLATVAGALFIVASAVIANRA